MKFLITGGAGYIGSFMTKRLLDDGNDVVVVDSLERGYKNALDPRATFIQGDLCDFSLVSSIFSQHDFDGVIHFAAYIAMGESMENPFIYFNNNIQASLNIIESMVTSNVKKIIFSSTAGVYGSPTEVPIKETHRLVPENPYGESKLMVEKILAWYKKIKGLSYAVLRYFNAAGAALDGSMGESHDPESHIIPNIIRAVLQKKEFTLFGADYATPDKTCVRDYIHVLDLVEAHMLALKKIQETSGEYTYNVGTGNGFSNKQVIAMVEEVAGEQVRVHELPRRLGDADILIADVSKITQELHFEPKHSDLKTIVETAWNWHNKKEVLALRDSV